jgi:tyrosyl-tRNA synthetase
LAVQSGSIRRERRRTSSVSSGCRPTIKSSIEQVMIEQASAPEQRRAQRALADEMTTMVHGEEAATAAGEAAEVLFGGDPTDASAATLAAVAAEVPNVEVPSDLEGMRVHELLVAAGLAKSNGEVTRLLGQRAVRAGNRVLDADGLLRTSDLLNGQFLVIRKGKRDFLVGKSSNRG